MSGSALVTLRLAGREVKSDCPRLRALALRSQLMQTAIDRRGEEQARRADQKSRDRDELWKSRERHARATLHRDQHRGGDERPARESDRDRRERGRDLSRGDELLDTRLRDRERAHRNEQAKRNIIRVRQQLVQGAREGADAVTAHRIFVGRDLLLERVETDELVDDRDDVEAGREVASDDDAQRIAVLEVVPLVEEDRAKLLTVGPRDQRRRQADARSKEPVAEREGPLVSDDVDALI